MTECPKCGIETEPMDFYRGPTGKWLNAVEHCPKCGHEEKVKP